MKKQSLILIIAVLFLFYKSDAQTPLFNVKAASCYTCCDGAFTMTVPCFPGAFAIGFVTPNTYSLISVIGSVLLFEDVCVGTYSIPITSLSDFCNSHTGTVTIPFSSTGIFERYGNETEYFVYPNPTQNVLTIPISSADFLHKKITIRMLSIAGEQLLIKNNQKADENESNIKLNLSFFENGIYFLQIYNEEKLISNQKVIKN